MKLVIGYLNWWRFHNIGRVHKGRSLFFRHKEMLT
jgi:hypothetical protein